MRRKREPKARTPHDWPPVGTVMKASERDKEWWDGPVIRVTETWKLDYGKRFDIEVRGIILEPHDWPLPVGRYFTCYAHDLEIVGE